jgi:hypothetical protein
MLKPLRNISAIFLSVMTVIVSSCYTPYNNLKSPADFDNQIKINSLSFFGPLKYTLSKSNNKFLLLFKNDSLQYVCVGKKLKKHSSIYKVLFRSNTLNILSSEYYGKYYTTDTLFFFNDECFWKKVVYNDPPYGMSKIASPAVADFSYYKFSTTECLMSEKRYRYSYPTIVSGTVPLIEYCDKIRSGVATDSLIDRTYVSWKYPDKNEALLRFAYDYIR